MKGSQLVGEGIAEGSEEVSTWGQSMVTHMYEYTMMKLITLYANLKN